VLNSTPIYLHRLRSLCHVTTRIFARRRALIIIFKSIWPLVPSHHTHLHSTSFRSNSLFNSFRVPFNHFVSPRCQSLPNTSSHVPTRSLTFWSTSDRWLLHCTHCFSVCLTRSLVGFIPSRSPSFPNAFRRVSIRPCTSLHVPYNFHQHPTACSFSVLITSCLPQCLPLTNSTPTTTALGVVMGNSAMCDERVTRASPLWHPHKIETWGPFFTTQFEHLCKAVDRTIYIISTILEKDLFYFILLPSKWSDMLNFPAKMMPQNWNL